MSERVSRTILICEDDPQAQLVRAYMRKCGLKAEPPFLIDRVASREAHGGNVTWVLREFPKELHACRQRHHTSANTLLIVVADADKFEAIDRRKQFDDQLRKAEVAELDDEDPAVFLIPRRHVETWIRAALGDDVNEVDDYKRPGPKKAEIRSAAHQIHGWARDNPAPSPSCVASLQAALSSWKRIG